MPLIPDEFRDRTDLRVDTVYTSRTVYTVTWFPNRPDISASSVLKKIVELATANEYVDLEEYAPVLGITVAHVSRQEVDAREQPKPQQASLEA